LTRKTIRAQHTTLYRGLDFKQGNISTGEHLLSLLNYGETTTGKLISFTYVIVNDTWRFSPTGTSFVKDFSSKHATQANAAKSVTYAGEFHFRPCPDAVLGYKLVIDNNSGTYGPAPEHLPKLKQLLELNFPDLEVEALNFSDPQLALYKQTLVPRRQDSVESFELQ
jgi:hypothetical protein